MNSDPHDFTTVLRQALDLPAEDRRRLLEVLQRVCGEQATQDAPVSQTTGQQVPAPAADDGRPSSADEWLASLEDQQPWSRIQAIDSAMEQATDQEELLTLERARSKLFQLYPQLAVRHAVVGLASDHPVATVVGFLGLGLALLALVRGLLHVVF